MRVTVCASLRLIIIMGHLSAPYLARIFHSPRRVQRQYKTTTTICYNIRLKKKAKNRSVFCACVRACCVCVGVGVGVGGGGGHACVRACRQKRSMTAS